MKLNKLITIALFCAAAGITACNKNDSGGSSTNNSANVLKPAGPKPSWGPDIDDAMQVVIEKLDTLTHNVPTYTLTPEQARVAPSFADALKAVMAEHNISAPTIMSDTIGLTIPVRDASITARVYTPKSATGNVPVILYFHGGGWVIADANTYDASTRALCDMTGAVVISVNYRRGPENPFPTAQNDAYDSYKWLLANAASIKGDATRIAVVGESAGGNLACNVSIMARDSGLAKPAGQVLIYPVASNYTNSPSYVTYDSAMPLNKPLIFWFLKYFLPNSDMSFTADARISLVNANLANLPQTTIINAEIDPLQDDGATLQTALSAANVSVTRQLYTGVTHEFFGMGAVVPIAKTAETYAASQLKSYLGLK